VPDGPCLQLLIYPAVDMPGDYASRHTFARDYFLTRAHIDWFHDHYVPRREDRTDPRVAPLRAPKLGRVPAILVVAGLDPLRDEGHVYAARLADEGIPVRTIDVPGMVHGFVSLGGVLPAADAANTRICEAVREAFARHRT
jgi:acetyl esterase